MLKEKISKSNLILFILFAFFSVTGIIAAFTLTVEKFALLKNPNYSLSCDISAVISCGSVMKSKYAEMFGFPNPILGVMGYTVTLTIAMYFLLNKGVMSKLFARLTVFGTVLAFIFSYVLMYISVIILGSLCPYCLLSCFSATNMLVVILIYYFKEHAPESKVTQFINRNWYIPVVIGWYFVLVAGIYLKLFADL